MHSVKCRIARKTDKNVVIDTGFMSHQKNIGPFDGYIMIELYIKHNKTEYIHTMTSIL